MPKVSPLNSPNQQEISKVEEAERQIEQMAPSVSLELEKTETMETAHGAKETEVKPIEESQAPAMAPVAAPTPIAPKPFKDKHLIEIENILSEDLKEAYTLLPPEKQIAFKQEGEKVAWQIWQMVESAKIQVRKVIDLLRHWLKSLPGINKFFLEQELKLKTDKIIVLAKKHGNQHD